MRRFELIKLYGDVRLVYARVFRITNLARMWPTYVYGYVRKGGVREGFQASEMPGVPFSYNANALANSISRHRQIIIIIYRIDVLRVSSMRAWHTQFAT